VVDTIRDPHDERFAMHHGDPARPHVIVPGRDGRCRYEFLLLPGEDPEAATEPEFVRALVAPYRDLPAEDVVRCVVYQFHALMAERWRSGRTFLPGDAAHMMPPFAGQGLNTGIRDAFNLARKLALVLDGRAGDALLSSYETERAPHARAMVELSKRIGKVIMTTSPRRAGIRDLVLGAARHVGPARRYFADLRFKPAPRFAKGFFLPDPALCGAMLPQPFVLTASLERVRLDGVLGHGFALVLVGGGAQRPPLVADVWRRLSPRLVRLVLDDRLPRLTDGTEAVADADGRLEAALGTCAGQAILVRPDRYVAAVFDPEDEAKVARELEQRLGRIAVPDHARETEVAR
jgi:3-(3-hydroxy-phenyl)propionate hydroxylase